MNKKDIRKKFRNDVFERDNYTCRVCNKKHDSAETLDAHHITDRNEIISGGYVKENGITVCKEECHNFVEAFHVSQGDWWEEGLHPDDLYKMIGSSKELAIKKSNELLGK